jgi:hypothetical protein
MKDEQEIKQQWLKEMLENTAMQAYFKQFNEASIPSFMESYVTYKSIWVNHGKTYEENMEHNSIQWVDAATKHLEIIQQKKLFNAQCLWRAGKLEIPEIKVCYDFRIWEQNVLNCPFIEPISQDDIELYQTYLLQGDPDDEIGWNGSQEWQEYDDIIAAYNDNDNAETNIPSWYEFYDGRRGTSVYMTLPNIKGEKEQFYRTLKFNKEKAKKALETTEKPIPFNPNFLTFYNDETTDWFVSTFENKQIQQWYKAYKWQTRNTDAEDNLEYYLEILQEADEQIPIETNVSWQEGIMKAAIKYRFNKIAEALPEAYEQYLMNIEMNIAFPVDDDWDATDDEIRNIYITSTLKGRKLNGEPEDFDY